MGTAPFALPCLEACLAAGHEVAAVVSQPPRPHGRGLRPTPTAVGSAAGRLGLTLLTPERASSPESVAALRALAPDAIVVVAYGQILRKAVLEIPRLGCINVHGSLLPELRGAAPIQHAILRGFPETGVTTMFMDPGMDTGDIILQATCRIEPLETAGELAARLAPVGAARLVETLELLEAGRAPRRPQDSSLASLAPMLRKEDGLVDWQRGAPEIQDLVHGFNPSPGAHTLFREAPLKLWRAKAESGDAQAAPGCVESVDPLRVACAEGLLALVEVQPAGRNRMTGAEFARGHRLRCGDSLSGAGFPT